MTVGRNVQRWGVAGAMSLLLATGLLTRIACAPAQSNEPSTPAKVSAGQATPPTGNAAASAVNHAPAQPRSTATPAIGHVLAGSSSEPALAAGTPAAPLVLASDPASRAPAINAIPPVDRHELSLFASIERELKRTPPPEVHALVAKYRQGADRAALIAHVQRELPSDLPLRVTVLRWIDEVRPEPGRTVSAQPVVPARGNGGSWMRPLQQR